MIANASSGQVTVGVMARAPTAGRCKTRLFPRLDPGAAATLYQAMLLDTLDALGSVANTRKIILAAPEDDGVVILRALAPVGWDVIAQRGTGLGERLANGFLDLFEQGGAVALTSSDSPTMPISAISAALQNFGGERRALLGPAEDGGYYLIGLTVLELDILRDISWSTPMVAQQTRARLKDLGVAWYELPIAYDVDTPSDLDRLRNDLAREPRLAPRCATLLGFHP